MIFPVFKQDTPINDLIEKLKEETNEVDTATLHQEITLETFDVIQICIAILRQLKAEGVDIEFYNKQHITKLVNKQLFIVEDWINIP